jgi:hypothetical protein
VERPDHIIAGHHRSGQLVDVGKFGGSFAGGHAPTLLSSVSVGAMATYDNVAEHSQSLVKSMFAVGSIRSGGVSFFTPDNLIGSVTLSPTRSAAEVLKESGSAATGGVTSVSGQPEHWLSTHRNDQGFGPGHSGSGT